MNLKVAGVDIIRSSKGPLLLEVNSSLVLEKELKVLLKKHLQSEMIKAIEKTLSEIVK